MFRSSSELMLAMEGEMEDIKLLETSKSTKDGRCAKTAGNNSEVTDMLLWPLGHLYHLEDLLVYSLEDTAYGEFSDLTMHLAAQYENKKKMNMGSAPTNIENVWLEQAITVEVLYKV